MTFPTPYYVAVQPPWWSYDTLDDLSLYSGRMPNVTSPVDDIAQLCAHMKSSNRTQQFGANTMHELDLLMANLPWLLYDGKVFTPLEKIPQVIFLYNVRNQKLEFPIGKQDKEYTGEQILKLVQSIAADYKSSFAVPLDMELGKPHWWSRERLLPTDRTYRKMHILPVEI